MPCPAFDVLEGFLKNQFSGTEYKIIESHVEQCERCQRVLDSLTDDPIARKRSSIPTGDPDELPVTPDSLRRFKEQLKEAGRRVQAEDAERPTEVSDMEAQPDENLLPERFGNYHVLNLLGKGGMGIVYLAVDPELKRRVAIKTIRASFLKHRDAQKRFLREARAIAAVRNPHIINIYHVSGGNGVPWFVMELLTGETLEERLRREKKLSTAVAVRIARQVAMALGAAHQAGLVHRDIKPENIFLEQSAVAEMPLNLTDSSSGLVVNHDDDTRRDQVKLLDFGLARPEGWSSELSSSGIVAGTPGYMAPEQIGDSELTPQADLFSLGCVLYRMITGTEPFGRSESEERLAAIAQNTPSPPSEIDSTIPAELSSVTMLLLSKKPEDRPSGAAAVVEILRRIERQLLSGCEAVPAESGTGHEASGKEQHQQLRFLWWWIAGAGVLILIGLMILTITLNS
ncbi:MAG: serine/threonine protein kinase [Planctomyces sp.]|nr:serine/threonine protein kinase [Planctomyces sp.]